MTLASIVLLGTPGAGKGTQADRLAAKTGFFHLDTGKILRELNTTGTPEGQEVKALIDAGKLAPPPLLTRIILEHIRDVEGKAPGVIFSGSPRTVYEAERFDTYFLSDGRDNDLVFHLSVTLEELKRRAALRWMCDGCAQRVDAAEQPHACTACGGTMVKRADDAENVQAERWAQYEDRTLPVVEFYRERMTVHEIDGMQDRDRAEAAIWAIVEPQLKNLGVRGL